MRGSQKHDALRGFLENLETSILAALDRRFDHYTQGVATDFTIALLIACLTVKVSNLALA